MALLPVKKYPDEVLRKQAAEVSAFDAQLHSFLDSLAETMYEEEGIGLAATQVGVLSRVAVLDVSRESPQLIEIINPVITERIGKVPSEEGCLSIPGFRESITRNREVTVAFQDRHGNHQQLFAEGLLAICLQHEIDHLDGILFIDHLSRLKRPIFKKWLAEEGEL